MTATRSLRPEYTAVRTAREFCVAQVRAETSGRLSSTAMDDLAGDAAMVVSEFVTNAIRAGATIIGLEVGRSGGLFRIMVTDDAEGTPTLADPNPTAVAGRGLRIVDALSVGWGFEPEPTGKRVWAELELTRSTSNTLRGATGGAAGRGVRPIDDRMATG